MVVDDSKTMRALVQKVLNKIGYSDCLLVDSAEAANKAMQNEPIWLVILDWHMPEVAGIDFLKEMKATSAFQKIPVIMLTREQARENVQKAIQLGADGYLVKPLSEDKLREQIFRVAARHSGMEVEESR